MTICRRCHGDFDSMDDSYAEGVHWSCLSYDEKMALERCKHKRTYTAKICADCGKKVS